jgi:uncharacterized protein YndB with AHSA1/START domain
MRSAEARTHIAAPIDRVWSAWTDPTELSRWYPDRATGRAEAGQHLTWIWDCYGMSLDLEVLAAEPERRLLLRANPTGRRVQRQEIIFEPSGAGTIVTVSHTGFPDTSKGADERAGTAAGWTTNLAILRHYLEHSPGRDRATAAILTDTTLAPDQVFARLAAYPRPANSKLLAESPPYQLAYTWPALDAIVTLRAFPHLAGAHLQTWTPSHLDRARSQLFDLPDHLTASLH